MKPKITLIRAISSEFIRRKIASIVFIIGIVFIVLFILAAWLVSLSAWGWLLVGLLLVALVWGMLVLIAVSAILRVVKPGMSKKQAASVTAFVDKLERNLEHLQTPLIVIQFRVLRDLLWPRGHSFIKSAVKDSSTLHKDFLQLEKDFISQ